MPRKCSFSVLFGTGHGSSRYPENDAPSRYGRRKQLQSCSYPSPVSLTFEQRHQFSAGCFVLEPSDPFERHRQSISSSHQPPLWCQEGS